MQETKGPDGSLHQEIFMAKSLAEAKAQMDTRMEQLGNQGHKLVRRVEITNDNSIAEGNRHGGPHQNAREIARRRRQSA